MNEGCVSVSEPRIDSDRVQRALHQRADTITESELETALSKLEARGELTPERREVLRTLATRLARRITAAPAASVERRQSADAERTQAVARLFDLDVGARD
ncbi:glutamyl-tRNA reductase [Halovenus marina]|uniref:glutamyl-tRNA reductase n=1 Tax=Halovenus marina TaxID=3396621 RepID=UPI003F55273B